MLEPGRKFTQGNSKYRYGLNGKELDKETSSTTTYDYGFRIYNPALGRFLSVDPLLRSYPWYTPYQFAGNKPIIAIDLDGLEEKITIRGIAWHNKPSIQTQTAISLADESAAHAAAFTGIINKLDLQELKTPKEPPSVLEWGTMGELTGNEKREIIENTVKEFTICIGTSTNTTPNFNPNVVTETYTAIYDFDYTLLGNKEKIDDIKSSVKSATTVIEYASKVREMTGKLPKVLDKISGPSAIVSNTLEGDGLGVATEVGKILVEKGLTELAKKAPSLGPLIGLAKSNPVTLTIQFTFMNSAPANNNSEIKVKRTEELRMKTIGALLYLFENNNKKYNVQVQEIEHDGRDNTNNVITPVLPPNK
jgi:RHS repeat-associated protein